MKRIIHISIILFSICTLLFVGCSRRVFLSSSRDIAQVWPMFRGNHRHTGFQSLATTPPFTLLWSYKTKGAIVASPVITSGHLFASSWDKKIHILNPFTGKRLGRLSMKSGISSTAAASEGRLYAGSEHPHSRIQAHDLSTGKTLWHMETLDIYSSPVVDAGTVFFGSGDGQIYAVTADSGDVVWTFPTGGPVHSSPAVAGGLIYVGSTDNSIYALEAQTGDRAWQYKTGGSVDSSPAIEDGFVYVGSSDSTFYALDASTGDVRWTFRAQGAFHASPAVDDSTCYIGSFDGILYALAAKTGQLLWQWKTASILRSSPAVSKNAIFLGGHDGHLYILDKRKGSLLWKYNTGSSISSSPALCSVGIFVGCDDGYVYAFGFKEAEGQREEKK